MKNRLHAEKQAHELGAIRFPASFLHRRFGVMCFFCECRTGDTIDHLIPSSKGGTDTMYNLVPACEYCNSVKNNRMPTEHELLRRDLFWSGKMHLTPQPYAPYPKPSKSPQPPPPVTPKLPAKWLSKHLRRIAKKSRGQMKVTPEITREMQKRYAKGEIQF